MSSFYNPISPEDAVSQLHDMIQVPAGRSRPAHTKLSLAKNFTMRELELLPRLLNKECFSGSKDWTTGDMAERVLWLLAYHDSYSKELNEAYEIIGNLGDKLKELREERENNG